MHVPIQGVNKLLEVELKWLLNVRVSSCLLHSPYAITLCIQRRLVLHYTTELKSTHDFVQLGYAMFVLIERKLKNNYDFNFHMIFW